MSRKLPYWVKDATDLRDDRSIVNIVTDGFIYRGISKAMFDIS